MPAKINGHHSVNGTRAGIAYVNSGMNIENVGVDIEAID